MSAHEVSHVHTSPYSTVEQSTCYKINQVKVPRHFEKKKKILSAELSENIVRKR